MRSFTVFGALLIASVTSYAQDFPKVYNTETLSADTLMSADEAAKRFDVPDGFQVDVFASEPDVQNPIAMAWDAKGRLWVAENYTYAERTQRFQMDLRDRVLIFDNTRGNRFKTRKVFTDNVQMLTGLEVGKGGVWLMCPPKLIFVPDADGDDVPDAGGEKVVLDGFTVAESNYHNFANGLKFGPDGWLYGRCGGSCPGRIGKPGTPEDRRLALEGGIWRYHPERETVEVLTSGTTNPWGHDWNEVGEMFFCNTVNGHLWHMTPGAHYVRPFLLDPNRRTYKLIDMHADHWHFDTGQSWSKSRDGVANEYGGGHAHIGTMIYQGTNWPEEFRGKLFTINQHGRRVNQEVLERHESGYVAKHGKDILLSKDIWFQGIDLSVGPDGSVFIIDWSDTGECHERTGVHRESGRIFKVSHRSATKPAAQSQHWLEACTDQNSWARKQSLLNPSLGLIQNEDGLFKDRFDKAKTSAEAVQMLLALHAIGQTPAGFLKQQLKHSDEHVRVWAIRLLTDSWPIDDALGPVWVSESEQKRIATESKELMKSLVGLAQDDPSSMVRLTLASTLQRLPVAMRSELGLALVAHSQDADDHNLPMMIWYGLIPVATNDIQQLVSVAEHCALPDTLLCLSRCLAEEIESHPEALDGLLKLVARSKNTGYQSTVLKGISQGLAGWARAPKPKSWDLIVNLKSAELAGKVRELSVVFGDGRAMDQLKQVVLGKTGAPDSLRQSALETLIYSKPPDLREICEKLLKNQRLNVTAARGLASFDDPKIGALLVGRYQNFRSPFHPQIMSILVSRKSFARPMLEAIGKGRIPRSDLSAFQVRQIHEFGDAELSKLVAKVWGEIRETPAEKKATIEKLKRNLDAQTLTKSDKSNGRALFVKHCQTCHRLYGDGGKVGPDITGSDRSNLDYLLGNIIDPSSVVDKDYRMSMLATEDGRGISGLVVDETDKTLSIQTATELIKLQQADIVRRKVTEKSPMPEGLLDNLTDKQISDLIGYLQHPTQVDLPSSKR